MKTQELKKVLDDNKRLISDKRDFLLKKEKKSKSLTTISIFIPVVAAVIILVVLFAKPPESVAETSGCGRNIIYDVGQLVILVKETNNFDSEIMTSQKASYHDQVYSVQFYSNNQFYRVTYTDKDVRGLGGKCNVDIDVEDTAGNSEQIDSEEIDFCPGGIDNEDLIEIEIYPSARVPMTDIHDLGLNGFIYSCSDGRKYVDFADKISMVNVINWNGNKYEGVLLEDLDEEKSKLLSDVQEQYPALVKSIGVHLYEHRKQSIERYSSVKIISTKDKVKK
ncbi:hypothetical protein ACFL0W_05865 [Nanoarchaeota archaeon]